mmetsp:Transcript_141656/g.440394  ORF Transcript_141656/g.440394 Transcript_141656/m.440394 type:complete len:289 (+) Transcript_141656:831-1697(+)
MRVGTLLRLTIPFSPRPPPWSPRARRWRRRRRRGSAVPTTAGNRRRKRHRRCPCRKACGKEARARGDQYRLLGGHKPSRARRATTAATVTRSGLPARAASGTRAGHLPGQCRRQSRLYLGRPREALALSAAPRRTSSRRTSSSRPRRTALRRGCRGRCFPGRWGRWRRRGRPLGSTRTLAGRLRLARAPPSPRVEVLSLAPPSPRAEVPLAPPSPKAEVPLAPLSPRVKRSRARHLAGLYDHHRGSDPPAPVWLSWAWAAHSTAIPALHLFSTWKCLLICLRMPSAIR